MSKGTDGHVRDRVVELRRVPASELRANPKNWRRHPPSQAAAVRSILEQVGYADALLARETPDGLELIDGHLRVGLTPDDEVPVLVLDVDEAEAAKLLATLDPLAAMAETDSEALGALLAEVSIDDEALGDFLAGLSKGALKAGRTEPDALPEAVPPICKRGDLWTLGEHRLVCADATEPASWGRLMEGAQADMCWTDPPYGVAIASRIGMVSKSNAEARKRGGPQIEGDAIDPDAVRDLLVAVLTLALERIEPGGAVYVAGPSGPAMGAFTEALLALNGVWRQSLVWVKDSLVMGRQDYHYRHEMLFYGWKPGGRHTFRGGRSLDTVFEVPRPKRSEEHPTMKPVELVVGGIENSSRADGLVIDPFLGSGTTMIATEQTGRRCYGMDIDPAYCDVAIRRWEEFTGEKAERG